VEVDYAPSGLTWRLSCPVSTVVERRLASGKREHAAAAVRTQAVSKKRVLIVEDEAAIALEIAATIESAGFKVVGPAGSVSHAIQLIDRCGCDAAILDVELGRETAEPVALRLASRGTPFVTITGYARDQVPPAFRDELLIDKPLEPQRVVAELRQKLP
jgi:AmiR/NasT family two-component response regulator